MKTGINLVVTLVPALILIGAALPMAQQAGRNSAPSKLDGPCDTYASGGTPCIAAHSATRALYAAYNEPLYQVQRASDNTTVDIRPLTEGGVANAAAQDAFCANTVCYIAKIYDQSGKGNHLTQGGIFTPYPNRGTRPGGGIPLIALRGRRLAPTPFSPQHAWPVSCYARRRSFCQRYQMPCRDRPTYE